MKLAIFDDRPNKFYPVSLTRSVGDIRCGILKLRQRIQALIYNDEDQVIIDNDLIAIYKERHPEWIINYAEGDTLFVNSRVKICTDIIKKIKDLQTNQCLIDANKDIVAFRCIIDKQTINFADIQNMVLKTEKTAVGNVMYQNLADIIMANAEMITYDFEQYFQDAENFIETEPGVTILNPYQVWIGEDALLRPGVVIDATHGPVVIDERAEIMSHSVIMGPAYIGKGTKVKIGSKIYEGTSIGPVCKVGGEIEGSIIQAFSNKQHDGFLGHAYLGEWVNLGAGTNNSDLKNNYKPVAFYSYAEKAKIDSGYQFLGSIIADHTKTGINCTLNTGVVIGVGCNIWGSKLITDYIKSFSWGEADSIVPYDIEAFTKTAGVVKQRRNLVLSNEEENLIKKIYRSEQ
jgi:UDP-N-acetylglucosamine diphosphorylase/glucosamine-1-phosphate N-acetyltransferase